MSYAKYHEAYRRLCDVLTNMYATERTALDRSEDYTTIMELVLAGRDAEAVEMAKQFRDERGDVWREKAAAHGLIPTKNFENEV